MWRVLVLSLSLVACGAPSEAEDTDVGFPLAPWQMWGNFQVLKPVVTGLTGTIPSASNQLLRVSYGRPESWKFLFAATVLDAPDTGGGELLVFVSFDLTVGIGRSSVQIPSNPLTLPFVGMTFSYTGSSANIIGKQKWCTRAPQSLLNDTSAASASNPVQYIDSFVAEDIQLQGRAQAAIDSGPAIGELVTVQLDAYVAPVSHIRPEWFTDDAGDEMRFRGLEKNGT